MEEQKRRSTCEQRIKYGDILLLLHLLEPWVKVDDAVHQFQDFYLYAGFDCTNKWANFLCDEPRRQAMTMRLKDALGVTEEEIVSELSTQVTGVIRVKFIARRRV